MSACTDAPEARDGSSFRYEYKPIESGPSCNPRTPGNESVTAIRRPAVVVLIALAVMLVGAGPALAHSADESDKAGDLIRQAIAHIVHDPKKTDAAAEKIDDALKATNKDGVDMALVVQAQQALTLGDAHQARALLERSIGARSHLDKRNPLPIRQVSPLATGANTGIDVVTDPLPPDRDTSGSDWVTLSGLFLLGILGVYLAQRFRPHAVKAA